MKTCLVVEDNVVIRGIITGILTDLGLSSVEKDNAADGVAWCADNKPDAVLLDWDLPSLGALDFLAGVGQLPQDQRPDIVLCATENDHKQFTLASAAGAQHHLLKPFDKAILEEMLIEVGLIEQELTSKSA